MTEIADMGELVRPRQICSKYYAHTKREQAFFAVFIVLSSYFQTWNEVDFLAARRLRPHRTSRHRET
ncbi:hypothetical protein [Deinococcus sp.]|uniref:hypothetical protein n=1 Tax=Deinococcus sp. TaxID=47478 RepID=UPI0025C2D6F5|nr:hypothetical protein [Deinococcus sp.]